MITTEQIKELRDATGISVMQCKKALEEAGGDKEKALLILRAKSGDIATKKSDRTLGAGIVASYIHGSGTIGTMLELSCETDFVAKNEEFKKLAYDLAMQVTAGNPEFLKREDVTEEAKSKIPEAELKDKILLEQQFIKNPELTVAQAISAAIQKFGEKTEITRYVRFSTLEK